MQKLFLTLILLSPLSSFSQEEVTVQSLDPSADLSVLEEKGYKKVEGVQTLPEKTELPPLKIQSEIFTKASLQDETKNMDQIDRDLLYKMAQTYSLEKLSALHPKIPREKLKNLQDIVKAKK